MVKVLAPGFYARQDIRTPVKIALISLVATQALNFVLIWPFRHAGLALAIGLGACLNAGLLYYKLRQHDIYMPQPGWLKFAAKTALAIAAMSGCLWFAAGGAEAWLHAAPVAKAVRLTGVVFAGIAVYFGVLWIFGFRLRDFVRRGA
jgi:putative peptidoglycan lipid II flippase